MFSEEALRSLISGFLEGLVWDMIYVRTIQLICTTRRRSGNVAQLTKPGPAPSPSPTRPPEVRARISPDTATKTDLTLGIPTLRCIWYIGHNLGKRMRAFLWAALLAVESLLRANPDTRIRLLQRKTRIRPRKVLLIIWGVYSAYDV